jgi:Rrf2 family protein
MAIFSKTCEYAIRAVFYLASKTAEGGRLGAKDIAAGIDSPELYLAKILQALTKAGIVNSLKGPTGGFFITPSSFDRPLIEIVEALDGDGLFTGCALGLNYCSEVNPCPLHNEFKLIRDQIAELLKSTTIGNFNGDLLAGLVSLKRNNS